MPCHRPVFSPLPLAAAVAAALASLAANAAEPTLGEVAVRGQAAPETGLSIGAAELERKAARNVREIFQDEAGVVVGGGGQAIAQKIYVRGLEDTMLTVSMDGAPQGGNLYHHQARVVVDPALIKQVEVDKGTAQASSGPGGLGGAIRFATKDAADLLRPDERFGAMASGGIYSNDGSQAGLAAYGRVLPDLDFLFSANRQDLGDYEAGGGRKQVNSGSNLETGLAKLQWRFLPGHSLTLGHQASSDEGMRFLRPNMVYFAANGSPMAQKLTHDVSTATWRHTGDGALPQAEITAYRDDNATWRTNNAAASGKPAGYRYGETVVGTGVNGLFASRLAGATLRYGFNVQEQESRAFNPTKKGVAGNTGEETTRVTGVFAESALPLAERWLLAGGARYDRFEYTDNHDQKFSSSGLSPNASLSYQATSALSLRTAASRTLRGAGLKESFFIDNGPGPNIYRNVADLRAEKARNLEAGFNYQQGEWSVKGSLYRLTIDDYINTDTRNGYRRLNAGRATVPGYELSAGWKAGDLAASAGVAYSKPRLNGAEFNDTNPGLGLATGRTWTLGLDYEIPAARLEIAWASRWVEEQDYLPVGATTRARKAGYDVHDLRLHWQPLGPDRLRVSLSVLNLFDKFYYSQASYAYNGTLQQMLGYAEPGRDIRLDLSWKF